MKAKNRYGKNESYMNNCFFESIDKKNIKNNDTTQKSKIITIDKQNKDETSPTNSFNSKSIKKKESNKIKTLENENAHLRKLLLAYKLKKKSNYNKSTEKNNRFNNYFIENKLSALSDNKTNNNTITNTNNNNSNLSNMYINNEHSLKNNSNYIPNTKSALNSNLLDSILDKIPTIPKNIKNKNYGSCSVLLTDGNLGKTLKRSRDMEIRTNSKKNKIIITEIKFNNTNTNTKIKKISKIKMNSLYYNKNNIINNGRDIFNLHKNNILNNTGNITLKHHLEKRKNNCIINNNINSKRNKHLTIKSSHHSVKLNINNPIIMKIANDYHTMINKNNSTLKHKSRGMQKDMKTFHKHLFGTIINHNTFQKANSKTHTLYNKKKSIKLSKKKIKNYHSISSVVDATKMNERSQHNSSISFVIKKINNNNEKDKSINKKKLLERFVKKSENNSDNRLIKDTNELLKNNKNLQFHKTSKKKITTNENLKKKLKNMNNNISKDIKLINSNNKRKNNIFFTINKTIINNMNNTFNNSNNSKNCLTNKNNSEEVINNDLQMSSSLLTKTINDNNSVYNAINLKKKLISKGNSLLNSNNTNNNKYSVLKININDKLIKQLNNK